MKNRKGKIKLSKAYIELDPLSLLSLFSKFIPFHIENNYLEPCITYYGISELFDEVKEFDPIPRYDVYFTTSFVFDRFEKVR